MILAFAAFGPGIRDLRAGGVVEHQQVIGQIAVFPNAAKASLSTSKVSAKNRS
jgi:hypothetical protein